MESDLEALTIRPVPERTRFIGRERERTSLVDELRSGARLLTIAGPSGMGKTRLARQVMAQAAPFFEAGAGVRFCSLAACRNEAEFQATVAQSLGLTRVQGRELGLAIADRGPLLLVLDNLESVLEEARPTISSWLDLGVELQLLTTSLLPTDIEGEFVFALEPLDLEDAVELYLERARRAWHHRSFSDRERPVIEQLVQRLDRIPLAIELAAARVRVLPPRQLLARISERFELLQSRHPGRHRSLLEALSLTWRLLEPEEQELLARASLFEEGFDLNAAVAILGGGDDPRDPERVLQTLEDLGGKALIQLDDSDPPRFTLYESVREFASLQLERSGGHDEAARAHATYYVNEGEAWEAKGDGDEAAEAMRWLAAERANLIVAHRRMLEQDPALSARAGLVLTLLLFRMGPPALETEILCSTLEAAKRSGRIDLELRARHDWLRTHQRLSAPEESFDVLEEGLAVARAAGERVWEGYLLMEGGAGRLIIGDLDRSISMAQDAMAIAEETGERMLRGLALAVLGAAQEGRSSLEPAGRNIEEAVGIFRQTGKRRHLASALAGLGAVRSGQGRFREAREALVESCELFRWLGHRAAEASVIGNLGSVELTAGRLDEAERFCRQALAMQRETGNRRYEALAVGNLGLIALERGEIRLAEQRLLDAISKFHAINDRRYYAMCLAFLAVSESLLGRLEEARTNLATATQAFEEIRDQGSLDMLQILEGLLELSEARRLAQAGQGEEAASLEARARERLDAQGDSTESLILARRLLRKYLANVEGIDPAQLARIPESALILGPEAEWFELDGKRIDLQRRGTIRRLLQGLVEQRLLSPGIGLSQQALFKIGWPGESIAPESAAARVYTAIGTLRSLGLASILVRREDGYLLDPGIQVGKVSK